ncbi:MAG TPA: SRPBCC family protein [Longimicrobium sp.]|nr:SRPBCC family protein [Longimicrobium sp.]
MSEIAERLRLGDVNMGRNDRLASVLGGAGLALLGARQRGVGGALLGAAGAALIARGAAGHCPVYQALGASSRTGLPRKRLRADEDVRPGVSVSASITVPRPAGDAYAVWRDFTNAPRYMDRITSVEVLDETRSRWTATGPTGRGWTWESQVVEDSPGELIAWESLPGSELPNRGWVQFVPAGADGRQTEVRYFVEFDPPGGVIGNAIAHAFHDAPREMVRGDLRRFRGLLEAEQPAPAAELALEQQG